MPGLNIIESNLMFSNMTYVKLFFFDVFYLRLILLLSSNKNTVVSFF